MKISIVLPAYNEAKRLKSAVDEVYKAAQETGYDFEIIIAEDGSKDGTDRIAAELAAVNPKIRHVHSDERLGRGKALMNAFSKASGEVVVYMDVDLSTDLSHLKELVDAIIVDGYDFATGSRLMKGSQTDRPAKREIASRVYNFLVRLFLGSKLHDHQCGFKAFKKEIILELGREVKDNHWFWDTEVLVLAQKRGYRVREIPVKWQHGGETKVEFRKDVVYMFSQILRMWFDEKKKSKRYLLISTLIALTILGAIAIKAGVENVYASLISINLFFLLISTFLYSLSYILRGVRFDYILRCMGRKEGVWFSTAAVSISQTVNVITPIRLGDLARAYVFKKKDVPYSESIGGIAAERFFDLISVAMIAAFSALLLGAGLNEPAYALIFAGLIFFGIIILSRMENVLGRVFKNAMKVMGLKQSIVLTLLSLLLWFSDIAVCYIIALSFGGVSFMLIALAVAVGNIIKALPITPGGVGTYEAAVTAVLLAEFSPGTAFTLALVDHAVKNVTTVLLGLVSISTLNISLKEVR